MKYLCLVYLDEKKLDEVRDSECAACGEALRKSGHSIAAEALQSVTTATTVRVRDGKMSVTDGPFAETKEQLAGYVVVECESIERAVEIAARYPDVRWGALEVRPIMDLTGLEM